MDRKKGDLETAADAIQEASDLYSHNWQAVAPGLLMLFLISVAAGLLEFLVGQFNQSALSSDNPFFVLAFGVFPIAGLTLLSFFITLLNEYIVLPMLPSFENGLEGRTVSKWVANFKSGILPATKLIALRFLITLAIWSPFFLFAILNMHTLVALANSKIYKLSDFFGGPLTLFFFLPLASALMTALANFLLSFLEIEYFLQKNNLEGALSASYDLVTSKFGQVFAFNAVWFGVWAISLVPLYIANIAFYINALCPLFLLPLYWAIGPFVITPLYNLSLLDLWKKLRRKPLKEENPEEYIREVRKNMTISWV